MADEIDTGRVVEGIATETATAPAAKKTRAPRRSKIVAETVTASARAEKEPAKAPKAKRGSNVPAAPKAVNAAVAKKATTKTSRVAVAKKDVAAPVGLLEDIADLIKLEEENKSLRKQLSEKLRAENADLRKRLGQN